MREFICIMCPMGCALTVKEENGSITVKGNTCKRGEDYGKNEYISPKRVVTGLIKAENGEVISVKTEGEIDKKRVFDLLSLFSKTTVKLPIGIGDVIIENVFDSGINVVATKNME